MTRSAVRAVAPAAAFLATFLSSLLATFLSSLLATFSGPTVAADVAEASPLAMRFTVRDVGSLGGPGATVTALNNLGQVVGAADRSGVGADWRHAFATGPDGVGMVDLCPALATAWCGATGIDDDGLIVGSTESVGFTARLGGSFDTLLSAGGRTFDPSAINAAGRIVGAGLFEADVARAVTTVGNGEPLVDLGALSGASGTSWASALNDKGWIVGCGGVPGGQHAFLRYATGGAMTDLGTLGGANSCANAINSHREIVGYADTAVAGQSHAVLWNQDGPVDLGTLGGASSTAMGINRSKYVVGYSTINRNPLVLHAFFTQLGQGRLWDLNGLVDSLDGVTLETAVAINDRSQILATGSNGHGYLLTPLHR